MTLQPSYDLARQNKILNNYTRSVFDKIKLDYSIGLVFEPLFKPHRRRIGCCCCELEPSNTKVVSFGGKKKYELANYIFKVAVYSTADDPGPPPGKQLTLAYGYEVADRFIDAFRGLKLDWHGVSPKMGPKEDGKKVGVKRTEFTVGGDKSEGEVWFAPPKTGKPTYDYMQAIDQTNWTVKHTILPDGYVELINLPEGNPITALPDKAQDQANAFVLDFTYQGWVPFLLDINAPLGESRRLTVSAPFVRRQYR